MISFAGELSDSANSNNPSKPGVLEPVYLPKYPTPTKRGTKTKRTSEFFWFQYRWIGGGLTLKLYLLLKGADFVVSEEWLAWD